MLDFDTAEDMNTASEMVAIPKCCTTGCDRKSWNGKVNEYCCRTCLHYDGKHHGDVCNETHDYLPECYTTGCDRKSWNIKVGEYCCRTCWYHDGEHHGDVCNDNHDVDDTGLFKDAKRARIESHLLAEDDSESKWQPY